MSRQNAIFASQFLLAHTKSAVSRDNNGSKADETLWWDRKIDNVSQAQRNSNDKRGVFVWGLRTGKVFTSLCLRPSVEDTFLKQFGFPRQKHSYTTKPFDKWPNQANVEELKKWEYIRVYKPELNRLNNFIFTWAGVFSTKARRFLQLSWSWNSIQGIKIAVRLSCEQIYFQSVVVVRFKICGSDIWNSATHWRWNFQHRAFFPAHFSNSTPPPHQQGRKPLGEFQSAKTIRQICKQTRNRAIQMCRWHSSCRQPTRPSSARLQTDLSRRWGGLGGSGTTWSDDADHFNIKNNVGATSQCLSCLWWGLSG